MNLEQRIRKLELSQQGTERDSAPRLPALCRRLRREREGGLLSDADAELLAALERRDDADGSSVTVSFLLKIADRIRRDYAAGVLDDAERAVWERVAKLKELAAGGFVCPPSMAGECRTSFRYNQ